MKTSLKIFIIQLIVFLNYSCHSSSNDAIPGIESVSDLVSERLGKQLNLIDTLKQFDTEHETFSNMQSLLAGHKKKVVVYIDGTCFTCAEDFVLWKDMIKFFNDKNVSYLFYLYTTDLNLYKPYFHKWRFTAPIIVDNKNTFFHANKISLTKEYQAMLLDENNKVVVFGNPVYNEKIKGLYLKVIQKQIE